MLYDVELKNTMLDALQDRVSGICNMVMSLLDEGYIPNTNKFDKLSWVSILIHAYENVEVLSEEQHTKLDSIYNKIML